MKPEYDFSNAERGKFHRPDAELNPPVRLDPPVRDWIAERARAQGTSFDELVNALLRKEIELVELAK